MLYVSFYNVIHHGTFIKNNFLKTIYNKDKLLVRCATPVTGQNYVGTIRIVSVIKFSVITV